MNGLPDSVDAALASGGSGEGGSSGGRGGGGAVGNVASIHIEDRVRIHATRENACVKT